MDPNDPDTIPSRLLPPVSAEQQKKLAAESDLNKDGKLQIAETAEYVASYSDVMRAYAETTPETAEGAAKRAEIARHLRAATTGDAITQFTQDFGAQFPKGAETPGAEVAQTMSGVAHQSADAIAAMQYTAQGDAEREVAAKKRFAESEIGGAADRNQDGKLSRLEALRLSRGLKAEGKHSEEARAMHAALPDLDLKRGAARHQQYGDADPEWQVAPKSTFKDSSAHDPMAAALKQYYDAAGLNHQLEVRPADHGAKSAATQQAVQREEAVTRDF